MRIMLLFIRMFTRGRPAIKLDPEAGTAKTVAFVADDAGNVTPARPALSWPLFQTRG